jgi:hypothetical protein
MSGYSVELEDKRFVAEPPAGFIQKPFSAQKLLEILPSLIK